jgi:hypothetical protein
MKRIRTEWVKTEYGAPDFLSVISESTGREICQLRRNETAKHHWSGVQWIRHPGWTFRPMTLTDEEIYVHFGQNWYNETYSGFSTVKKFYDWARWKGCL